MRNWFYIAIIILLTGAVVVVWETPPEMLLPGDEPAKTEAQLFSVVSQAYARHFDEVGDLSYTFNAEELRHYRYDVTQISDADYTIISEPEVTFYSDDPPWHMSATTGRLTERGLTLVLSDEVRIWQPATDTAKYAAELHTEQLTVRPMEKTARTDAAVTIDTPIGSISAVGMVADLRNQRIQFLSQVQGTYDAM